MNFTVRKGLKIWWKEKNFQSLCGFYVWQDNNKGHINDGKKALFMMPHLWNFKKGLHVINYPHSSYTNFKWCMLLHFEKNLSTILNVLYILEFWTLLKIWTYFERSTELTFFVWSLVSPIFNILTFQDKFDENQFTK